MKEAILKFIKRASWRVRCQRLVQTILVGTAISLGICLIFLGVSLGITIAYTPEKCLMIVGLGLALSCLYSQMKAPKKQEVALLVDQTGLNERLSTAYMLLDSESPLSQLQREDTLKHLKGYNLKKQFPIQFSKRHLGYNILLLAACVLVFMIPTSARQEEGQRRAFEKEKNELVKQIESQEQLLNEETSLTEAEKAALSELLQKTQKEVKTASANEAIEKSMQRLEKKLEKLEQQMNNTKAQQAVDTANKSLTESFKEKTQQKAQSDLESLQRTLVQNQLTKDLAEALQRDETPQSEEATDSGEEAVQQALEALEEQLGQLSEAEKEALANTLASAAASMNDQQLASQLSNAANAAASGQMSTQSLKKALQNLKQTANGSQSSNGTQSSNPSVSGSSSDAGQNGDSNQAVGSQGSGNGQGQGQENGAVAGGQGGSGSNGNGGASGTGWNTGSKKGHETSATGKTGEAETSEVQGYETELSGETSEEAQFEQSDIPYGINIAGEKIDYRSVVGEYTEEALDNVNKASVPENKKEAIKAYFESINQSNNKAD